MALKLTEFVLDGEAFQLVGTLDEHGNPTFHMLTHETLDCIRPEGMNDLARNMQDELYDMMVPEPVKCKDGSTYCFARDSVIERFMKDNAEEVQGDDRAQEGTEGR